MPARHGDPDQLPKPHWLRENAQERAPWRVLVVDTETRPIAEDRPEHQVLRLWCARLDRRRGIDPGKPRQERWQGRTAAELADLIESLARSDHALWIMTHNLSFDLAVTALPVVLAERGWRLTEGALTTDSPWCRMARKSRRLTVADTWSWLPTSVDDLGTMAGLPKLPLPAWEAPDAEWWARCERDVAITADAIGRVMDWWDAGKLGNWSITGPATGWSSYRHRRPAPRVLIESTPADRELEARAIHGGRREVRRLGQLDPGLYADLDMPTAHLVAMASLPLPMRRLRHFESLPLDAHELRSSAFDVLAEATIETATPRYPWDSGRGIFHPVGRFRSVLAGPELREAIRRGELRSIGRGIVYQTFPHMQDWAVWLAGLLDPAQTDVPPEVRLLAKSWSRSVPGKWAGHTSAVLERWPDPRPGWQIDEAWLPARRQRADLFLIGGERWTIVRDLWADDAFPAVLAFIQSAVRVALGRLVDRLGPAVVSMNTDGVLVDARALAAAYLRELPAGRAPERAVLELVDQVCQAEGPELAPFGVRVKHAYGRVRVISPQHLVLDRERRLSGIPARAVRLADGRWTFTAWPKLHVQLTEHRHAGYRTREVTADLRHVAPAGWLLADGRVLPVMLNTAQDGGDAIGPSWTTVPPDWPLAPAALQHPVLRRLVAGKVRAA